ncbi:WXG100 family type VII secretion target [Streptomyces sp. NPDC096057]|uniref:WXG100 family type VII secretion target n=1 Tax=Streptomyces sp. NPDC096057 TaxID=3155543 RepID=UPI003325019B
MSEGIYINHSQASEISVQLHALNKGIEDIVQGLEQQIGKLVNQWAGPDQEVYYNQIIPAWSRSMATCSHAMESLVNVLMENSQTLKNTSLRNAQNLESI